MSASTGKESAAHKESKGDGMNGPYVICWTRASNVNVGDDIDGNVPATVDDIKIGGDGTLGGTYNVTFVTVLGRFTFKNTELVPVYRYSE